MSQSDEPIEIVPQRAGARPTIRDVAKEAGVSKSLVSLVYSNDSKVSDERRQRVLEAASRLGFRPNLTARSLAAASGDFTGILVADLHNPVFAEIVDAARAELSRKGRVALLTSAMLPGPDGTPELDRRALAVFGDLRPRSILVLGSVPDMGELDVIRPRIPVVIASAIADHLTVAATVRSDDTAGMRLVVAHLVERGHRRIAHIGGRGGIVAERRVAAYAEAMAAHGLASEIRVEPSDYSERGGYTATRSLLEQRPATTAVAAVNDLAAVGALAAIAEAAPAIPVAVTGYDNSFIAQLPQVSLTSVDPHNAEIGVQAAHRVIEAEEDRASAGPETLVAPSLVVRGSTSLRTGLDTGSRPTYFGPVQ